jgi:hypothetical protein
MCKTVWCSEMLKAVMDEAAGSFTKANDQKLVADMFLAHRYLFWFKYVLVCNLIVRSIVQCLCYGLCWVTTCVAECWMCVQIRHQA